jgi:hypothetical protein
MTLPSEPQINVSTTKLISLECSFQFSSLPFHTFIILRIFSHVNCVAAATITIFGMVKFTQKNKCKEYIFFFHKIGIHRNNLPSVYFLSTVYCFSSLFLLKQLFSELCLCSQAIVVIINFSPLPILCSFLHALYSFL